MWLFASKADYDVKCGDRVLTIFVIFCILECWNIPFVMDFYLVLFHWSGCAAWFEGPFAGMPLQKHMLEGELPKP